MQGTTRIGDYDVRQTLVVSGVVRYDATHVVLPRRAVVEILEPAAPRTFAVRMMRHACILEALHHPGIPRVFECGMQGGRPWVAYERTEGLSLESDLRTRQLEMTEVLDLLEQVAAILTHAHARGVLHRDITPSTIVRDSRRQDTLILEGWANACTLDTELASPLKGSNRFRAPELVHGLPADGRADVFALGSIAYQALLGDSTEHTRHEPTRSAALRTLVEAMIADEPVLRPTAAEVVNTITAIRDQLDISVTVPDAQDELPDVEQHIAAMVSESDYASVEMAYMPPVETDDDTTIDIMFDEIIEQPRARARWTPQWGALDKHAAVARGVVEIVPRRKRTARQDTES